MNKNAIVDSREVDEEIAEDKGEEWFEVDLEDCPELFCLELFAMLHSDPFLQCTSGSEDSGPEDTDIEPVSRKVKNRRQQYQVLNKRVETAENEKNELAIKVAFVDKEKKRTENEWCWQRQQLFFMKKRCCLNG